MKTVRWGIIGCGNVTEVKSGPAFYKVPDSELVAVMRRDEHLARDYAKRHNVSKWYAKAEDLINDPDVDAVYIATPPASHKEYALLCAKARKPVYVEKPMAISFTECNEMLIAAKDTNTPLFVAFYRRALPRFQKIYELINIEMVIGRPIMVNTVLYKRHEEIYQNPESLPWHVRPEISGGGLFVDLAPHTLDILDFLFGEITSVKGYASSQLKAYPAEDCVSMSFIFKNGMHGVGHWNFCSYADYDNVEVIGDKGKISFATFGDGAITVENAGGKVEIRFDNPEHIQMPMITSVVNELLGKSGGCLSTGESAARTNWVMDQVLSEYYSLKNNNY